MQYKPSSLVANLQVFRQHDGRDTSFVMSNEIDSPEPFCQVNVRFFHNSSNDHSCLIIRSPFEVDFKRASDLVNQLSEAQNERQLSRYIKAVNNCHLLICDELGYLNFDLQGASLLFQVFAARYELSSTMITSNLVFSKWPDFLGNDSIMSTALVDRLIHRAEILNMYGDSYRLKEAKGMLDKELSS
jgi:hypothetical protein